MTIASMVENTLNRWNLEALLFCAAHGKKGGKFELVQWANGAIMAQVPGARANQAITAADLDTLMHNGWKICR